MSKDVILGSGVLMSRTARIFFIIFFIISSAFPLAAQANHVRIRTFAGMEPYGRLSTRNWGSGNMTKKWNTSYGFTPGLEFYIGLNDLLEVGAGFKWQLDRQVYRTGGSSDETFAFIPVYLALRFNIMDIEGVDMHAILRLGYAFFDASQEFRNIWIDENGALVSTDGGMYGAVSLGVTILLLDRPEWGIDYSMDAGYAYYGAAGRNVSDETSPISYQSMEVDFSLDWRF